MFQKGFFQSAMKLEKFSSCENNPMHLYWLSTGMYNYQYKIKFNISTPI